MKFDDVNNSKPLNDESPMPDSGIYKGRKMVDIPDSHLIWLYKNDKCSKPVRVYIKDYLNM